jgi:uncharacterized lipoprotein YmbA
VLYTLAVVPGPASGAAPHNIEIRRIGLAGYLDRPGIVRSSDDYKLTIATDDRWGEPLGGMLLRVLAEDLSQRLPGSSVYSDAGAISANPDAIVEVDLQRLNADASGTVTLVAQVSVGPGTGRATTRTLRASQTPKSASTSDYVGAMSALVGELADVIAVMLKS